MPLTEVSVDISRWSSRNMWLGDDGQLRVRPGMKRVWTVDSGRDVVAAFSVFNYHTDEPWHYIVDVDRQTSSTSNQVDARIKVYDEDWVQIQELPLYADRVPRDVTHALIGERGFLVISSPDFATVRGLVGGGLRIAEKVSGSFLTSVEVPRGLCTKWANRVVIAEDNLVYISDPVAATGGDPMTFVAANVIDRMGKIIGLHATADDLLVAVTTQGVWGFPGEALESADVADSGARWMHIQDYEGVTYRSSCIAKGKLYLLTREGFRMGLTRDPGAGVSINMERGVSTYDEPVWSSDWRSADMFAAEDGPIVSERGLKYSLVTDVDRSFKSWWGQDFDASSRVVGICRRPNGEQVIVFEHGAYVATGNYDGAYNSTSETGITGKPGELIGRVEMPPASSHVLRHVHFMTDIGGQSANTVAVAVNDSLFEISPVKDPVAAVIGTSTWNNTGNVSRPPQMRSHRAEFDERGDEFLVTISCAYCDTRIGRQATIEFVAESRGVDS